MMGMITFPQNGDFTGRKRCVKDLCDRLSQFVGKFLSFKYFLTTVKFCIIKTFLFRFCSNPEHLEIQIIILFYIVVGFCYYIILHYERCCQFCSLASEVNSVLFICALHEFVIPLEKKHSISLIPKVGHLHTFIPHLSGFYLRIFRGVEKLIGMLGIDGSISHVLIGGLFVGCDVIGFEVSKIM